MSRLVRTPLFLLTSGRVGISQVQQKNKTKQKKKQKKKQVKTEVRRKKRQDTVLRTAKHMKTKSVAFLAFFVYLCVAITRT